MRGLSRITCLWPGLTRLWWRGELSALAVAIAFAILLNLLLWVTMWPSDRIPIAWMWAGWLVCLAVWCTGVWDGGRYGARLATKNGADPTGLA